MKKHSVVILKSVALFCYHPGFIEEAFSSHSQKCHIVLSSDHGYFGFCLEIRISHFLKSVSFTAIFSTIFDVVNTEYLLFTVFTSLCVFIANILFSLANQYKLIVTGLCKTKRKTLMILYLHRNKTTEKRINCSDMRHFMAHCVQYHLNVGFGVASSLSIFLVHSVYSVWSVRVLYSCIS